MRYRENSLNETHQLSIEERILMSKIGVMMSADRVDEKMSSHFGKAEWIMVADTENPVLEFVRNIGLNGKNVVEIVIRQGCTDVILTDIGDGALGHLQAAHIRAWAAPQPVAGSEALRMFREGQLPPVPSVRTTTKQDMRHGCCCSSQAGSEGAACCRG
jgi:predicted Fe-Mo cluster-binding NifX family protein